MNRINFAGNDYLGLARDPRLAEAACRAAREYGISPTSGRFFLGWSDLHRQLEHDLADFFSTEDACLLPTTYLGGLVFFWAMAAKYRTVFCDEYAHLNLIQGMRAAGFDIRTFRHLDASDLDRQLAAYAGPPPVVCTDGIYGISGEIAPIRDVANLAKRVEALLLVDDAHGVFAMGPTGRGTCEAAGLNPNEVIVLGSMSKALGAHGGFFVGPKAIIEKLQRGSAGSSPSPFTSVAACLEAIRILRAEPGLRARMQANAARMKKTLGAHGVKVVAEQTPILAMILKDAPEAMRLAEHFESLGLVIRYSDYPSEPRKNLLRSAARTCYTDADIDRFEAAVKNFFGR